MACKASIRDAIQTFDPLNMRGVIMCMFHAYMMQPIPPLLARLNVKVTQDLRKLISFNFEINILIFVSGCIREHQQFM